jgi:glycolate oxidase subunit GlcD
MDPSILQKLVGSVGEENVSTREVDLYSYSTDVSVRYRHLPDVVVRPKEVEQISRVMRIAHDHRIPVTPRGAGSGVAGGAVPVRGGIVIDLTGMNKILEVDLANQCVVVQAGVVHQDLNDRLAESGYFFPPDPSSNKMCTLGGQIAVGGSGPHAVKYGGTRNYVLGLTIVLPDGHILRTGGKTIKRQVGYNLAQLFIGSEGTLGIIAEAILRIIPLPEWKAVVLAAYDNIENAAHTVNEILGRKMMPASMELLDNSAIRAVNQYRPQLKLPDVDGILMLELDGSTEDVKLQAQSIERICGKNQALSVQWADDPKRRTELWEGRSVVGAATSRLMEKYARIYEGEDITVPVAKVVDAVKGVRAISRRHGIPIITFGHIGDGNLHPAVIIDKKDPEHWKTLDSIVEEIQELALSLGGTVSGEHGVGILRAKYIARENGPVALAIMRQIKRVFDPHGIMNPGKLDLEE